MMQLLRVAILFVHRGSTNQLLYRRVSNAILVVSHAQAHPFTALAVDHHF